MTREWYVEEMAVRLWNALLTRSEQVAEAGGYAGDGLEWPWPEELEPPRWDVHVIRNADRLIVPLPVEHAIHEPADPHLPDMPTLEILPGPIKLDSTSHRWGSERFRIGWNVELRIAVIFCNRLPEDPR